MKKSLERLDSYELRTSLIWGWLFFFCVTAIFISFKYGWESAAIPSGIAAFMSLFEAIRWFAKACLMRDIADLPDDDTDETGPEYADEPGEVETAPVLDAPKVYANSTINSSGLAVRIFDDVGMRHYSQLRTFVNGVVSRGIVSKPKWNAENWSDQDYLACMDLLLEVGICKRQGQGKPPVVTVPNEDAAWRLIDNHFQTDIRESLDKSLTIKARGNVVAGWGASPLPNN